MRLRRHFRRAELELEPDAAPSARTFRCGTARTLDGVRVVFSVTSDTHNDDELSELVRHLCLQLEAECIRMRLQRRAIERLAATIRTEWKDTAK
jgi:hypothetical protein